MKKWKHAPVVIVLLFTILQMAALWGLFSGTAPYGDDNSYHLNLCHQAELCLVQEPLSILDFWVSSWNGGFPIFQYYHHLSPIVVALIHLALPWVALYTIFKALLVLLFGTYPLFVYGGLRKLGVGRSAAMWTGLLSLMSLSRFRYEQSIDAYLGDGLYSQLFGMVLFPLGLAAICHTVVHGRRYFRAVVLLALAFVSHSVIGFHLGISALLALALPPGAFRWKQLKKRVVRLALVWGSGFAVISYWMVPMLLNMPYNGEEPFAPEDQRYSYGTAAVMGAWLDGSLFDDTRFQFLGERVEPVEAVPPELCSPLSALVTVGFLLSLLALGRSLRVARRWRRSEPRPRREKSRGPPWLSSLIGTWGRSERLALLGFSLWLVLFFGRRSLGLVIDPLPLSDVLPFNRFIFGVHFFGTWLAGIAIVRIGRLLWRLPKPLCLGLAGLLLLIVGGAMLGDHLIRLQERARTVEDMPGGPELMKGQRAAADYLEEAEPGRMMIGAATGLGTHFSIGLLPMMSGQDGLFGFSSSAGMQALPFYAANFLEAGRKDHQDLYNLRYWVLSPERPPPPFGETVLTKGSVRLHRIDTPGYFELVQADLVVYGDKERVRPLVRAWLRSRMPLDREHLEIRFERRGSELPEDYLVPDAEGQIEELELGEGRTYRPGTPDQALAAYRYDTARVGTVVDESIGFNKYQAEVEVERAGCLMLKVSYHPGWRVTVDGEEAELIQLSPAFLGVRLAPGHHRVRFRYHQPPMKPVLFVGGLVLLLFLLWWDRCHRDRRSSGRASVSPALLLCFMTPLLGACGEEPPPLVPGHGSLEHYHPAGSQQRFPLSALNPVMVAGVRQVLRLDERFGGGPLRLGGATYRRGLGQATGSGVMFRVDGFRRFSARFGLDDGCPPLGPGIEGFIFRLHLDRRQVFQSEPMRPGDPARAVDIELSGAHYLVLEVRQVHPERTVKPYPADWVEAWLYR